MERVQRFSREVFSDVGDFGSFNKLPKSIGSLREIYSAIYL